jgi:hypothetical protein
MTFNLFSFRRDITNAINAHRVYRFGTSSEILIKRIINTTIGGLLCVKD